MSIDITAIVVAIIGLIGAIITSRVMPWLKARTTSEQWSTVILWARAAVKAAEVLYDTGQGKAKLKYALDWLSDMCKGAGVIVDADKLRAIIEQTWLDLTNTGEINKEAVSNGL